MKTATSAQDSIALARCLDPLLDALGWKGDLYSLEQARPATNYDFDISSFMNTLANLGFLSKSKESFFSHFDPRLVPALFITEDGAPYVIYATGYQKIMFFDGRKNVFSTETLDNEKGTFVFFTTNNESSTLSPQVPQKNWFNTLIIRFRPLIILLFILSFFLTITALLSPIMIISIYKFLGSADSYDNLTFIGIGIALLIFADTSYKIFRNKIQAYAGARINTIVGSEVFRRILYLPPQQTENASIGAQMSRIKDLSSVRSFIDGPAAMAIAELPFIIILYIVLTIIAQELVIIPIIAAFFMVLLVMILHPWIKSTNDFSSKSNTARQTYLLELVSNFTYIRYTGVRKIWLERYSPILAKSSEGLYKTSIINTLINTVSQGIITIAGALTITVGVYKVILGEIPVALLLGLVMLVWRILNPLKSSFSVMSQSLRIKSSVAQLNRLMQLTIESLPDEGAQSIPYFKGAIHFQEVSLRYNIETAPALLGVTFTINPKDFVIVTGHAGSGKSSILKLLLGIYKCQAGQVLIDGYNIQQLNPILVRRAVSYIPEKSDIFSGTIRDNILLGNYYHSTEELLQSCERTGFSEILNDLSNGIDSPISEIENSKSKLKFMAFTRAILQDRDIVLIDTPEEDLTKQQIIKFYKMLQKYKNRKTIILITDNAQFQTLADTIITMSHGRIDSIIDNNNIEGTSNEN